MGMGRDDELDVILRDAVHLHGIQQMPYKLPVAHIDQCGHIAPNKVAVAIVGLWIAPEIGVNLFVKFPGLYLTVEL